MAICNKCGTETHDRSGFCHTCGTSIGKNDKKFQIQPESDETFKSAKKGRLKINYIKWLVPAGLLLFCLVVFLFTGNSGEKTVVESSGNAVKTEPVKQRVEKSFFRAKESEAEYNKKIVNLDDRIRAILYIKTIPENAEIKILNSKKTFTQGMKLKGGKYWIKVNAANYIAKEVEIVLKAGKTKNFEISLVKYSRLYVKTKPAGAKIKLLKVKAAYKHGIRLIPGVYRIKVEAEKYIEKEIEVILKAGKTKNLEVSLVKFPRLYVITKPVGAKVKILNISSKYKKGMALKPGSYTIEVSEAGFTKTVNFKLAVGDVEKVSVTLDNTNSVGMKFAYIKPGSFNMGSNGGDSDEKPVHSVTLSYGFYMQTTEVTQGQWQAVMRNNPSSFKNCDDCPVENVSWNDAKDFINKLNRKEEINKYRLPTEAEWEYACRAGSDSKYANGNNLDTMAWYKDNSNSKTHPVAGKKANNYGLFDMHGNVWEWCEDLCDYNNGVVTDTYRDGIKNPLNKKGSGRVARGGSWSNSATYCRSAGRFDYTPGDRYRSLGFRLSRTL